MAAKHNWLNNNIPKARNLLADAFTNNVNNEAIALAAAKLERELNEYIRARKILQRAQKQCDTPKVILFKIKPLF